MVKGLSIGLEKVLPRTFSVYSAETQRTSAKATLIYLEDFSPWAGIVTVPSATDLP